MWKSSVKFSAHLVIQLGIENTGGVLYGAEFIEAMYRRNPNNDSSDLVEIITLLATDGYFEWNENLLWIEELTARSIEESLSERLGCDVGNNISNGLQGLRMASSNNSSMKKNELTDLISGNLMNESIIRMARTNNSDLGTMNRTILTDLSGELNRKIFSYRKAKGHNNIVTPYPFRFVW